LPVADCFLLVSKDRSTNYENDIPVSGIDLKCSAAAVLPFLFFFQKSNFPIAGLKTPY